ncbi:hypothetical protein BS47DRAFT_1371295 [Hydnum rufescens UP504]|uniref:Phosphoserine phosphatase n=1 Tax=Hydnum rufescens UP504 TaxID=1448309 RepID=A0A9P6B7G1_9AGAM|nr:hypothetical protein BS47DRAFT_1371295 [Hydnum rufescens UP504]
MATDSVPKSTLPYPSLYKDAQFVVLSDWDGTITNFDSNDYLTDNLGFGQQKTVHSRDLNIEILQGHITFRDAFRSMLESVPTPFDECVRVLKNNITLDPGFEEFFKWCKDNGVPVIIVSSGMAPLIRGVLSNLIGEEYAKTIDIISNEVDLKADGSWSIKFRHPDRWGILDSGTIKSQAILPYRELTHRPTLFFFGDGVSDMSAARHADVLFVKNDKPEGQNDLAAYVKKEGIKHILFKEFSDALPIVQSVVRGAATVDQVLEEGRHKAASSII